MPIITRQQAEEAGLYKETPAYRVDFKPPGMTQEAYDSVLKQKAARRQANKDLQKIQEKKRLEKQLQEKMSDNVQAPIPISRSFNKTIPLGKIIGLPPYYMFDGNISSSDSELILSSMPIMAVYPAYPDLPKGERTGLQTFKLNYELGREKYKLIIDSAFGENCGLYDIDEHCIYVAFTNDASLTESFSSEFGESRFEQLGNLTAGAAEELRYMTGKASMGEAITAMSEKMPMILSSLTKAGGGLVELGEKALEGISGSSGLSKILSGSKIDFPLMWKGSAYAPSYSVSIRLYNPNPRDLTLHKKYIVEPLSKLLAFIIPISDSPSTYTYPVLCSVSCPGLFMLKAAYVSSIEVIKGGDANDISFIQRPGIVDIKITLNDLYGSIIAENRSISGGISRDPFRPTFYDYINQLSSCTDLPAGPGTVYEAEIIEVPAIGKKDTEETTNTPVHRVSTQKVTIYRTVSS